MGDQLNQSVWLTDVIRVNEEGEIAIDLPREILFALALKPGDSLLWTLLPGGLGFSVSKVARAASIAAGLSDGVSE